MKFAASLLVLLLAAPLAASILHAQCNDPAVLITGGVTSFDPGTATETAELYDPKTDTFIQVGEMNDARVEHTATRLLDGSVLGGRRFASAGGSALASAELFDPATKTFTIAANMHEDRAEHAATRLPEPKCSGKRRDLRFQGLLRHCRAPKFTIGAEVFSGEPAA